MRLRREAKKNSKREIANRRMVKALAPPAAPSVEEESINTTTNLTSDGEDNSTQFVPENKTDQNEVLKEKTEQWRQERLDATAASRKEKKEKEVLEHRRKMSIGDQGEEVQSTDVVDFAQTPVPSILSVTPKFPEHKRKASSEDHVGKKSRVEEDEEEKRQLVRATKGVGWVGIVTPIAIAAVAALVALKFLRKR